MKTKKIETKTQTLLRRILGMHESNNCGAYNGEAVLSESVADEIREILKAEGIKADSWKSYKSLGGR